MNRGIRSLENGGMSGGPIWDRIRQVMSYLRRDPGIVPRTYANMAKAKASELRPPIQADTLVGKPREDLYKLLDLQREGALRPEGGQQFLQDVWQGPAADSLATLHEQLTKDAGMIGEGDPWDRTYKGDLAPDISIGIPEVREDSGPSWGTESWQYEKDTTDESREPQAPYGFIDSEGVSRPIEDRVTNEGELLFPRDKVTTHRVPVDPDLPVPANVLGYAEFDPWELRSLDWGRPGITLDPYHAMHGGYGEGTPEGYVYPPDPEMPLTSSSEEDFWDARKQSMGRTLAHEYSHIRRGPQEAHSYRAGPEYGDPQEVAAAAWQALRETQDPERYSAPNIEDAVGRAEEWYNVRRGSPEKIRESIRDELELFLKQPIYEGHRIRSGPDAHRYFPLNRRYRPSVSKRDKYPWRWR